MTSAYSHETCPVPPYLLPFPGHVQHADDAVDGDVTCTSSENRRENVESRANAGREKNGNTFPLPVRFVKSSSGRQ